MQPRWLFGSGNENLLGLASDSKPAANSYSNTSPNVAIASCVMLFIAFMNAVTSVLLKKLADEKVHPSAIILMSGCSVLGKYSAGFWSDSYTKISRNIGLMLEK